MLLSATDIDRVPAIRNQCIADKHRITPIMLLRSANKYRVPAV
jgi:hypothetical protein